MSNTLLPSTRRMLSYTRLLNAIKVRAEESPHGRLLPIESWPLGHVALMAGVNSKFNLACC